MTKRFCIPEVPVLRGLPTLDQLLEASDYYWGKYAHTWVYKNVYTNPRFFDLLPARVTLHLKDRITIFNFSFGERGISDTYLYDNSIPNNVVLTRRYSLAGYLSSEAESLLESIERSEVK